MPPNKKQQGDQKDTATPAVAKSAESGKKGKLPANVDVVVAATQQQQQQQEPPKPPPKSPYIIHRSKDGLKLIDSFKDKTVCAKELVLCQTVDKDHRVESVCCSEDGELIAWCDKNVIKCIKFENQEVVYEQANETRSNSIMISPRSTKLVTFNTMSGGDNLHFWDLVQQKHLASMPYKKASQWRPIFSMNEDVCFQHISSELLLYVGGKFDKPKQRISHMKVNAFSLSSASFHPNQTYQQLYEKRIKNKHHYLAIYSAGAKGQPSIVRIFKYPNLTDCVTNKSFFKADSVKFSWSPSGTSLLLVCQADFDKSGKSYYGEQSLNFMNIKGDSYFVKLPKEGNISHLEWFPSCDQEMFVCVYGLMPAKVSLFDHKCETLYNFEHTGSFNEVKFNPFGNLIAIYGFGNLAGQLCVWDFEKKKLISTVKVPETTGIEWSADGLHLLTCTTSPRLRVGNGFRLWHYTGSLLYELIGYKDQDQQNLELYDLLWQPMPGKHKKPKIDGKASKLPNLMSNSKLSKFQGTAGKYVPPSARNTAANAKPSYMDSAVGIGAGGREIVGLESLSLHNSKPKKPRQKKKKPQEKTDEKVDKVG